MAESARAIEFTPLRRRFGMRDLARLAGWGLSALAAITVAVSVTSFDFAQDRLILAAAHIRGVPPPERLARTSTDPYARQVVEALRDLRADRDRLLVRLDTVERNVGDVTASITRAPPPPPEATATPPQIQPITAPPVISAPEAMLSPTPLANTAPPMANVAHPIVNAAPTLLPDTAPTAAISVQPPADDSFPAKAEFAIDLGRAGNVEGIRQLWTVVKGKHGSALDGLRPLVTVRELARTGGVELRLIVGPLPSAAAAARLCASLIGATCHPTAFDGQKLALR